MTGKLPTVAFCGWGRAGKDTAGKFLGRVSPLRYIGSLSWVGKAEVARRLGLCEQEAWETRHDRRQDWYRIRDSLALGEIVVGVRDAAELAAARSAGLITHAVWVHKPDVPKDPTTTYGPGDCDLTIRNDSTVDDFHGKLLDWFRIAEIPLLS